MPPSLPTTDKTFSLPALRSLGDLKDVTPTILADTREQVVLPFKRLPWARASLGTADYSFAGGEDVFAVERKGDLADLIKCATTDRERFEREMQRLRGFRFRRLLLIGSPDDVIGRRYRSTVSPKMILHSLATWEARFDLPVIWAPTPEAAAELVETWVFWFAREIAVSANLLLRGHKRQQQEGALTS